MDIGPPRRIIEIQPDSLPLPELLPDPSPRPAEPAPAEPEPAQTDP